MSEKRKYEVAIVRKFSTVYEVEADSEQAAAEAAWEQHKGGGPCHQCADTLGDEDYAEAVVFALTPPGGGT